MLFMDVYGDSMDESVEENPADKLTVPGNAFEGKSGGRLGYHQGWASGGPMFYRVYPVVTLSVPGSEKKSRVCFLI